MYDSATALEATEAKLETVFAGYEDVAQGIVDEFQILTPATESATRSMVSGIQDLLVPMGFVRDEATEMTGETMELVGALTNFNSATHGAEDVASAFTSALTGEYTSLKALGIQVDATTVQEEVLAMGMAATTDEITSQMEAQALLSLAYAQSTDALAAYNEESLDTVTRMGLLQAGFTDTFAEAGQSLLPAINEALVQVQNHMPTIVAFIYAFGDGLGVALAVASSAFEVIMDVGSFMVEYWSIMAPLIGGVVTALGLYNGALAVNLLLTKGMAAFTAVQTFLSIGWGVLTGSTAAASAAMFTYNSALLACPVTWIVMVIIAVIAVFYAAVAAVNHFAGTSISATGLIAGAIAVAGAAIWNTILGVVNAVVSIGVEMYNLIATFANFFANVFNDPVGAIINLFSGMFDFILGIVQATASLIDTVLGTDMASAVEGFRNTMADMTADIVGEQTVVMEKLNASDYQLDRIAYSDAFDTGYSFGEGVADTISGMFGTDVSTGYDDSAWVSSLDSIASDTSDLSDTVSASATELEYLRELAEQETVNRFTTAEIKVDMGGVTNQVSSTADLDGIISYLTEGVNEAMAKAAEGVHT